MRRSRPTSLTALKRPWLTPTSKRSPSFLRSNERVAIKTQLASCSRGWLRPRSLPIATVDVATAPSPSARSAASVFNSIVLPLHPAGAYLCTSTAPGRKPERDAAGEPLAHRNAPGPGPSLRFGVPGGRGRTGAQGRCEALSTAGVRTAGRCCPRQGSAPNKAMCTTSARPASAPRRAEPTRKERKGASSHRGTARRPILAFFCVGETTERYFAEGYQLDRFRRRPKRTRCRHGFTMSRAESRIKYGTTMAAVSMCPIGHIELGCTMIKFENPAGTRANVRSKRRSNWRQGHDHGVTGRAHPLSVAGAIQLRKQLARMFEVPGQTGVIE